MPQAQFDNSMFGNPTYSADANMPDFTKMLNGAGYGDLFNAGLLGMGMMNYQNPADSAMPYLQQAQNQLPSYFQPWMDAGKNALPQLQQQYGNLIGNGGALQAQNNELMNNPSAVMNRIGSTFQASPGYNWQAGQAMNAANHAAAAGGMLGSPAEQQGVANSVGQMANQDYYNYLNHGMSLFGQGLNNNMSLYGMGLNGLGDLSHMGLSASSSLGEDLSSLLQSQAQLAYAGQADKNQSQQGSLGGMGSLVSSAIPLMMM
jgi:hypothetical protein